MGVSRLRAAFEGAGLRPRKRHGQHFLVDDNLLRAIVRDAGIRAGELVLEVGPGPGVLTRHLVDAGAQVVAFEIDPAMRALARSIVEPELLERVEWHELDVLDGSRGLAPEVARALPRCQAIVANLPYNVAAPFLAAVLLEPLAPGRAVVTIQREMGLRLVARPGSKDYGPLSVLLALGAKVELLRKVPPAAFWPRPAVESVVLRLEQRLDKPQVRELQELETFLRLAFSVRRKTLRNALVTGSGLEPEEVSLRLGGEALDLDRRAEQIEPLQFRALARTWAKHAPGERHRPI